MPQQHLFKPLDRHLAKITFLQMLQHEVNRLAMVLRRSLAIHIVEVFRAELLGRVRFQKSIACEFSRLPPAAQQTFLEPLRRQVIGSKMLSQHFDRHRVAVFGVKQLTPGVEPHIGSRIVRPKQICRQAANFFVAAVRQTNQSVDRNIASVDPRVLGGQQPGCSRRRIEQLQNRIVKFKFPKL